MAMKVCKLVRLTKKDSEGNYVYSAKSKEGQIEVRKRVIVDEATVAESDANFQSSGLLYVVDEKATAERDDLVEAEVEASRENNVVANDSL